MSKMLKLLKFYVTTSKQNKAANVFYSNIFLQVLKNSQMNLPLVRNSSKKYYFGVHQCYLYSVMAHLHTELPLPLYLWNIVKNSSRTERLSCTVALVALLVCISLITYFSVKSSKASKIWDKPSDEWNITRDMWLAQPYDEDPIPENMSPVMLVIIQHTVSSQCTSYKQCAEEVKTIQGYFIKDKGYDIPYNFLIGNDGRVYEGRGWNIEGAHTYSYNLCSLGVGFIGDYREEIPNHARVTALQLNRTRMMFDEGVRRGFLRPDFQVVGAKDLHSTSASPGSHLYNAIKQWDNYDRQNRFANMTCQQIQEKYGNVEL